jgi:hypothetical protein
MTKRKKFGFASLAVLLLATGTFLYFRAMEKPIEVHGQLSPEDLDAIKSAMRHEIWRDTLSNLSFKSLGPLSSALKTSLSLHIDSIYFFEPSADPVYGRGTASVRLRFKKSGYGGSYVYAKSTNGWVCVKMVMGDQYKP